ncbi:MAG TPA: hypothetical protein VLT60_05230 [Usitatibacter sp.]|nr:hypothetical protein [Usitatibacter sp.]
MKHKETYNGHQIAAETVKRERGYIVNYQIDGGDVRASRDQLKSEEFALYWAITDAKAEIDRMTGKK